MSERTRIDRLIEDVLACAPGERDAFLDAACEGNDALRREIASLLEQASRAHSFLEEPAAAPSLVGRTRCDEPLPTAVRPVRRQPRRIQISRTRAAGLALVIGQAHLELVLVAGRQGLISTLNDRWTRDDASRASVGAECGQRIDPGRAQ